MDIFKRLPERIVLAEAHDKILQIYKRERALDLEETIAMQTYMDILTVMMRSRFKRWRR
jgi:hypothetical protein